MPYASQFAVDDQALAGVASTTFAMTVPFGVDLQAPAVFNGADATTCLGG
jgi:hypothetical protein